MNADTPPRSLLNLRLLPPVLLALAALAIGLTGIGWGLPSQARNRLYFYDRPPQAPDLSQEEVVESWRYFPEFSWSPERQGMPDNLAARTPRSIFNPIRSYHPDEYVVLKSISNLKPAKWDFDMKFFAWPSFFIYLVAVVLKLASLFGFVALRRDLGFYYEHPDQMARLYLVGRLVVCAFGAGTVVAVYSLGKRLLDWRAGAIAGLVMLLSPAFLVFVHEMRPDIAMVFFVTLSLIACASIVEGAFWRSYILAGVFIGLAMGCKYDALYAVLALLAAHFLRGPGAMPSVRLWGHLLAGLVCAGLVFAVTNPYQLVHFREVWWVSTHAVADVWAPLGFPAALIPWHMLTVSLGMGVLFFAVFGIFMGGRRTLVLSVPLAALYILHAFTAAQYVRHYLVLFPFMAVLSGAWITFLWTTVTPGRRAGVLGLGCAVFVLIVVLPMADVSWSFLRQFTGVNTRDEAGQWIASYVPKGATVAVVAEPWQYTTPPLDPSRFRVLVTGYDFGKLGAERPDYLVLSSTDFVHAYGLALPMGNKLEFLTHVEMTEGAEKVEFDRPIRPLCRFLFAIGYGWPEDMILRNPKIDIYKFRW